MINSGAGFAPGEAVTAENDMGLDSVEIVMCWEDSLGFGIPDKDASHLHTVRDAIDYLARRVNAKQNVMGACLSLRAFHKVRRCLMEHFAIRRQQVTLHTHLRDILPDHGKRHAWKQFCTNLNVGSISPTLGIPLFGSGSTTIKDLVVQLVARHAHEFLSPPEQWTRHQVKQVVYASVEFIVGQTQFSEDQNFVKDILKE